MYAVVRNQAVKLNAFLGPNPLSAPADIVFTIKTDEAGSDFSGLFQAVGTLTTLTASLQVSLDGGTTFADYIASANFISAAAPVKNVTPLVGGAVYKVHATALTGSQDIWLVTN